MRLIEKNNQLMYVDSNENECKIHVIHCNETLAEIKQDVYRPFLVAEEAGQFAKTHLVTASTEYDALQTIHDYIIENGYDDDGYTHIIGAFKLTTRK